MSHSQVLLHFSSSRRALPPAVEAFAAGNGYEIVALGSPGEILSWVSRAYPAAVVLDGSAPADDALSLCRRIKDDAFTSVVPVVVYSLDGTPDAGARALEAGADEVLTRHLSEREAALRFSLALRRAERDVSVHPTTRLPGTVQIERDVVERLRNGQTFAVCYADLDHFKEFNDRYGYHNGDRVILIVSRILREVVRAHSPSGFVGHIGGDDFIFTVPFDDMDACCSVVLEVFSELIPLHYTEDDRERGWYQGKDRRGNEYRVPLMTLSIGVVTNRHRELTHTAEISELAAEMKSYAKSIPGSVYAVDRRSGDRSPPPPRQP